MKEKNVPIEIKDKALGSPHTLRWPKKPEKHPTATAEIEKTPVKPTTVKSERTHSPDLLFHSRDTKRSRGVVFIFGSPFSVQSFHILLFAVLMFLLVVPFQVHALISRIADEKRYLLSSAVEAENVWQEAYTAMLDNDFETAEASFIKAQDIFADVASFPRAQHPILVSVLETSPYVPRQYQAFKDIVRSGFLISQAGARLSYEGNLLTSEGVENPQASLTAIIDAVHLSTDEVLEAHFLLSRIDPEVIPTSSREKFITMQSLFDKIIGQVANADAVATLLASMAGLDEPRLWLVVFQNNAELRASGGFMGSYVLAKADTGEISIIDAPGGGTYDLRGSFRKNVVSPEPLHLINPVWEFQDSNWWPDWPTTAKKINWFYEQGNGATVDGVVSFTPAFLERVLDITGPIHLEDEYDLVIDKYNAYDVLQVFSERKLDVTNEPKKIIGDLASEILEQGAERIGPKDSLAILSLLLESVEERQLLVYWNESAGQDVLATNGWDGALVDELTDDYLMVVHSNIAGGKSDRTIRDVVEVSSTIQESGRVINEVTLTRTHHGKEGTDFSGVRNVDYVRFYVPEGSTLISAKGFTKPDSALFETPPEGFEVDEDYLAVESNKRYDEKTETEIFESFGKTVFANWLMVDPGESQSVTLQYALPDTLQTMPETYSAYIQKQSGWQGAQVDYTLTWPASWSPLLVNGTEPGSVRTVSYQSNLSKDIRLTTSWEKNTYAKR